MLLAISQPTGALQCFLGQSGTWSCWNRPRQASKSDMGCPWLRIQKTRRNWTSLCFLSFTASQATCSAMESPNSYKVAPLVLHVLISSKEVMFPFLHASEGYQSPPMPIVLPEPVNFWRQNLFASLHLRANPAPHLHHRPIPTQHRLSPGQLGGPRILPMAVLFVTLSTLSCRCMQRGGHRTIYDLHIRIKW
jgi:hypothetical protein